MHGWALDIAKTLIHSTDPAGPLFDASESGRRRGREYLDRIMTRTEARDSENRFETTQAQYDAVVEWGIPDPSRLHRLKGITAPTLIATGSNDIVVPPVNSQILAAHRPHASLRLYPDAGHGFLFQYPTEFAGLITAFLSATSP
jgi:pimeloyl-ACP methyl ester carboxylesterase